MALEQETKVRRTVARLAGADGGVMFTTALGKLVKERRRELKLPQTTIEKTTNGELTQNWLSKVETGEYQTIALDKLDVLARALDLPVVDLLSAMNRTEQIVAEQIGREFAVAVNPLRDLEDLIPGLSKPNQATLVRMARILAYGERMVQKGEF